MNINIIIVSFRANSSRNTEGDVEIGSSTLIIMFYYFQGYRIYNLFIITTYQCEAIPDFNNIISMKYFLQLTIKYMSHVLAYNYKYPHRNWKLLIELYMYT